MKDKLSLLLCLLVAFAWISCGAKTDVEKEKGAIRRLLQQERKAHFDRDARLFMNVFADSMIFVNKGRVEVPTSEENRERITRYFSGIEFIRWDDTADPVIRISDDGSMAYAIIQKQVIARNTGSMSVDTTDYAWVSIYKKINGSWKIETNISTNQ